MTSMRFVMLTTTGLVLWVLGSVADAHVTQPHLPTRVLMCRGGSEATAQVDKRKTSNNAKKKKKKKKRSKNKKSSSKKQSEGAAEPKELIGNVMKEKDSAQALGDAIRARADVLLSESDNPLIDRIDQSIASVGYAMGTSSSSPQTISHFPGEDETDGGGVEAAPTSVLANYFLKSHGGAHALQSACSLLAVLSSVGALLIPPLQLVLIKRTMMFTMTKHLSGLLAASTMAARAIPEIGLRRARGWIEKLSLDPVSQYVFYSALILLWLPSDSADIIGKNVAYVGRMTPFLLVGPILMREAVSTAFVISDIMVLLSTTASSSSDGGDVASPSTVLRVGKSVVDAIMSLLVTPSLWRNSDAAKRQAILAKLTSRTSLAMELLVGLLVFVDAVFAVWRFSIGAVSTRPKLMSVAKRLVCARLYINFLWVRRKRIDRLVNKIRGGAMQIPHRVLDALLDPKAAMGLPEAPKVCDANAKSWKDFAIIVLGLDE